MYQDSQLAWGKWFFQRPSPKQDSTSVVFGSLCLGNIVWNAVFSEMRGGGGGRKGFDDLFVRFFRALYGAVLRIGLLDDIFFWFSFPSLSVGLVVISFMLLCPLHVLEVSFVSCRLFGYSCWTLIVTHAHQLRLHAIKPPVTTDGYHWYNFIKVQLDERNYYVWLAYRVQAKGYWHEHGWTPNSSIIAKSYCIMDGNFIVTAPWSSTCN